MKPVKKEFETKTSLLRQKAESVIASKKPLLSDHPSETDIMKLIHELEVHQVELEMINDELTISNIQKDEVADKFTELYDFAPSGYFTLSQEGQIVELNLVAAKMLGKERANLIDNPFIFFISHNSKTIFNQFLKKMADCHTQISCELEITKKDDSILVVHLSGIFNHEKNLCHITAIDFTELRKAQEALQKSEKEFHQLAEAMPQIVWITLPDGSFVYFNQQWIDYTGQTLEESYGSQGWYNSIHPDDRHWALNAWQYAINSGEPYSNESRLCRFDGKYEWWLIRGVPVSGPTGNILKWYGTCTNIQELKHKEIELIFNKERAQESDRLKSAFLANMSHEIRTPMNGILGFTSLLKDPGLSHGNQQKYLSIIEISGARMLNIINDIIDISKIEAGLMLVSKTLTNVNEQIDFIYSFFNETVTQKGLKLRCKKTLPQSRSFIHTDSEKLYAILINLVRNAIKYTNIGTIEFGYDLVTDFDQESSDSKTSNSETRDNTFLQFYVKDTGIGISADRQAAIFERFVQADIMDIQARQGAGLGLTISKAYVEMLGGKIWVASNSIGKPDEKGSVFYFTIPYHEVSGKETDNVGTSPVNSNKEDFKRLKLLIVEDDEMSEFLLSNVLKTFCKEILIATTGSEAIKTCRNNPDIDLILMDIKLKGMDGYLATSEIREFNKKVIIIAQTAYALSGDREKAIEAGCNDYITKPIIKDELLSMLKKYYF